MGTLAVGGLGSVACEVLPPDSMEAVLAPTEPAGAAGDKITGIVKVKFPPGGIETGIVNARLDPFPAFGMVLPSEAIIEPFKLTLGGKASVMTNGLMVG